MEENNMPLPDGSVDAKDYNTLITELLKAFIDNGDGTYSLKSTAQLQAENINIGDVVDVSAEASLAQIIKRFTIVPKGATIAVTSISTPVLLTASLTGRNYLRINGDPMIQVALCDVNGVIFDLIDPGDSRSFDLLPTVSIYAILPVAGSANVLISEGIKQ